MAEAKRGRGRPKGLEATRVQNVSIGSARVGVRAGETLLEELKTHATKRGIPVSELLRQLGAAFVDSASVARAVRQHWRDTAGS